MLTDSLNTLVKRVEEANLHLGDFEAGKRRIDGDWKQVDHLRLEEGD